MARSDDDKVPHAREETDQSLSAERSKTDEKFAAAGSSAEVQAATIVHRARREADATLEVARQRADVVLDDAQASVGERAEASAERGTADKSVEAERVAADRRLFAEQSARRTGIARLLRLERRLTDTHLHAERERADQQLLLIFDELGDAVRLRDHFLTVAAEELEVPLTPLTARLDSLAREAERQADSAFAGQVKSYVVAANQQLARLWTLMTELLDVTGTTSGEVALRLEKLSLDETVAAVCDRHRPAALLQGCTIELEAASLAGRSDRLLLEQVVSNLLDNAVQFAPGGSIRVWLRRRGDSAVLTVDDDGVGISPRYLERIFDRFERGDARGDSRALGLGLYVCRAIVTALGGTIKAQSVRGVGSRFTVELPLSGPAHVAPNRL